MKKFTLLFAILLIAVFANAQITFQKAYGGPGIEWGYYVQQTTDGGYIMTGNTTSFGAGTDDIYLIKTNSAGDTLWTRTYGGGSVDRGYCVQQTTDSGYIIVGIASIGNDEDVYLIKTDPNGDTLWTKTYLGNQGALGNSVQQTIDGGYIITGLIKTFVTGWTEDVYLIKTDANGDTLWTRRFGASGNGDEEGYSVQQTADSGYIISGTTYSGIASDYDAYLIKTDVNGDTLWTRIIGGPNQELGFSVKQTTDGGFIIAGMTGYPGTDNDVYIIKTDSIGNPIWTKSFGNNNDDGAWSVQQTTDGGYIILGKTNLSATNADVYLLKTDAIGNVQWAKTFGGASWDAAVSVQQTTDGGYVIFGSTYNTANGYADFYLIKTNSLGNSGCNQAIGNFNIASSPNQIINNTTIVTSPITIVSSPPTIVGNGGTITTLCYVGIKEIISDNSFLITPNPSSEKFEIKFSEIINKGTIEIYNVLGGIIFTENISNESKKEINLKNISGGIYFVKVFNGEKYYCKKLIVE